MAAYVTFTFFLPQEANTQKQPKKNPPSSSENLKFLEQEGGGGCLGRRTVF